MVSTGACSFFCSPYRIQSAPRHSNLRSVAVMVDSSTAGRVAVVEVGSGATVYSPTDLLNPI